jgi:alpha-beta hydrolase superfamily lysophospholipase
LRIVCGLALLLLVACAPVRAPGGVETAPPQLTAEACIARDGWSLPLRAWEAPAPRAVIVALHGMSDYSEAFERPGAWWAQHGITTLAYDQRGFGRAPDPGLWAGAATMRRDLADCVEAARAVVLSALADARPPRVDGVILVAPAVWSRDDMPVSYRVTLWLAAHTVPWLHVSGNGLHIVPSDNIPMLRKLSRDPLFQHDARVDQVYGLVNLMDEARHAPAALHDVPPILLLYGARDEIIPAAPTEAVIAALGTRAGIRHYPNGYHMLLRDLDGETVWKDVEDWIAQARR